MHLQLTRLQSKSVGFQGNLVGCDADPESNMACIALQFLV
jgi:hypothetical protein